MFGAIEAVSPQLAKSYLEKSRGNRDIRRARLEKYSSDMRNGRFYLSPHGLCFDVEDKFVDGHHRCWAIVETGVSVPMFVVRGVPLEALPFLDGGLPRSARDALAMAGKGDFKADMVTVARSLESFPTSAVAQKVDPVDILDVIERNSESLAFACEQLAKHSTGVTRAVRALVARAWRHCDSDRLSEFCSVLKTGQAVDAKGDSAAVTYRNYLIREARSGSGMMLELEKYRKGQACLRAFLKREPMLRCCGTEADIFPL